MHCTGIFPLLLLLLLLCLLSLLLVLLVVISSIVVLSYHILLFNIRGGQVLRISTGVIIPTQCPSASLTSFVVHTGKPQIHPEEAAIHDIQRRFSNLAKTVGAYVGLTQDYYRGLTTTNIISTSI